MGFYINPSYQSKEEWLMQHGTPAGIPSWYNRPEGTLPVCLVENISFTAAAIAYDEREMKDFLDPFDHREKLWFYVEIEKLVSVLGLQGADLLRKL